MNVVTPYRAQRKPRIITGLDLSHPACRGLMSCVPLYEPAGSPMELVQKRIPDSPAIMSTTLYGPAMPTADGANNVFPSYGDLPAYDTPSDMTAACLLDVRSWSTATSGDFFWGKNSFQVRGWILLNNGVFDNRVGFRTDRAGTSDYAAVTRADIGTGLMLMVGRRTGQNIELLTVTDSGVTQFVNAVEGSSGMVSPAGANLSIGTTNANGDVQVLGCWLWDYALEDDLLSDLFASPWQMFRDHRPRTRMVIYRPVNQSFSSLIEGVQGVAQGRSSLVETWQKLAVSKTIAVDAVGYVSRAINSPVAAGGTLAKPVTSLVEGEGGASQLFSSVVEAKGAQVYALWPAELPQRPLIDGWREAMPKTGARTSIDKFPQTQQQRTKAGTWPLTQTIEVSSAQLDILWQFYEETLTYGTLPFDCPHPLTQSLVRMRFRGGEIPQASPVGWDTYHVSLPLEVMP